MKAMNVSGLSQMPSDIPPLRMTQSEKLLFDLILCLRTQRKESILFTMKLGMPKEMSLFNNKVWSM